MPSEKKSQKSTTKRTKKIQVTPESEKLPSPIKSFPTPTQSAQSFQLNVEAAKAPNETNPIPKSEKKSSTPTSVKKSSIVWPDRKITSRDFQSNTKPARSTSTRIWNTIEWIATSALLFMVAFFLLNYQAYSIIFMDKLNELRGKNTPTISVENEQNHAANKSQQPLAAAATPEKSRKQVPPLDMAITPPDDRVILPRINQNVPIVKVSSENLIKRDWGALESDIQQALQEGVVHYPGTAEPGENGNVVITGHSSYYITDPGKFKDVFALLHRVTIGDQVIVYHNQKKYVYEVYDRREVTPDKVDVLTQEGENRLTLITCTPVGTNLRRLIVFAKPVKI